MATEREIRFGLTAERARELLSYDAETGGIYWRVRVNSRAPAGKRAGHQFKNRYRFVSVDGHRYSEHRVIWLICKGEWPNDEIDHINGTPNDNRIENLREATVSQNGSYKLPCRRNKTGIRGVHFFPQSNRWRANISRHGLREEKISLSFDEAVEWRRAKEAEYFGAFSPTAKAAALTTKGTAE